MTTSPFLHCKDPRLCIPPAVADLKDPTTRVAIHAVLNALGGVGDRAICAPSMGIPVRVLGLRFGDNSTCLLNPGIFSAGPTVMSLGEMTPHTGALWYNRLRAQSMVVQGIGISGREQKITVPEAALIGVQQAFELMDHPDPFNWMTPFHHIWLHISGTEPANLYAGVSAGLRSAMVNKGKTRGLRAGKADLVEVLSDDDVPVGSINAMNPLVPVEPVNQMLLALLLELSGMRNTFFTDPGKIGLAVAATLVSPNAKVLFGGCRFPQAAAGALGLFSCIGAAPFGHADFPDGRGDIQELSSFVLDITQHLDSTVVKAMKTAAIAKSLSGLNGAMFIVCPAENQSVEEILQRHFGTLLLFETSPGGPVIYVARKAEVEGGQLRARLLIAANRIGAAGALLSCQAGAWRLRKDGNRDAL